MPAVLPIHRGGQNPANLSFVTFLQQIQKCYFFTNKCCIIVKKQLISLLLRHVFKPNLFSGVFQMKKKLLALAVAAALPMVSQAATADVTIYGKVHTSIDYIDPDIGDSIYDVTSRASRLGFKGSEDLGDGLKLIWKMETTYNTAEGGFGSGRNTYIGLAGGWGTFLYGRHDTPMKMSTGKLYIFVDELADYNATAGLVDIRASDAIAYVSPSFSGLTLVGAVVPDADYDGTGDFGGAYSVAAMYSNGGLFLAAAWEQLDDLVGGADATHWRVGAGFDMGDFHIGAVYADQGDLTASD
ncbi:MAG TPA: porin, partial [Chromatiaceae bacterium]|nr:porin [Chromatiaceae bacterium]